MTNRVCVWDGTRKPLRTSFTYTQVVLDGKEEEIANFATVPFDTPQEYLKYKAVADTFSRLITRQEWDAFYAALENS